MVWKMHELLPQMSRCFETGRATEAMNNNTPNVNKYLKIVTNTIEAFHINASSKEPRAEISQQERPVGN